MENNIEVASGRANPGGPEKWQLDGLCASVCIVGSDSWSATAACVIE